MESPGAEPAATEDPLAPCVGVEPRGEPLVVEIETVSYAFDTEVIDGPVHCQPWVIVFTNRDRKIPGGVTDNQHDINIRAESLIGPMLFDGDLTGAGTIRYEIPGLPAGEHIFYCGPHTSMNGTVLVRHAEAG